jgi:hypothetical protein
VCFNEVLLLDSPYIDLHLKCLMISLNFLLAQVYGVEIILVSVLSTCSGWTSH